MKTLRRGASLTMACVLFAVPTFAAEPKEADREVDWVKRLTAEFFELALAGQSEEDYSTPLTVFLSPELNAQVKEKPPESALARMVWQYHGGTFRLQSAEMAPNGSEVLLKGELVPGVRADSAKAKEEDEQAKGQAALVKLFHGVDLGTRQDKPAEVSIRVAKATEGGRWLIQFVRVKIRAGEK